MEAALLEEAPERDAERWLVERHRHGDPKAFDEIYERYSEMVFNLVLRFASDREDAADWTQEIFVRVFRHLPKFRFRSRLKTWVYRVAVNHCRSQVSRRRLKTVTLDEPHMPDPRDPGRGPESTTLATETGRRVADALSQVPPLFREAVVLRDIEGLSYDEIAQVSGIRLGTVRSRIARGRQHLREILEGGGP
jgi:RNA polymerase sigma-70 factor (ECF subfamily)